MRRAVWMTMGMVLALGCDQAVAQGELPPCPPDKSCFTVSFTEPPDADVAVCQLEVHRAGEATALFLTEEYGTFRNNAPRAVRFALTLPNAPGNVFEVFGTCKDEAGQRSERSNVLQATVPVPPAPNPPPAPPTIVSCNASLLLADGTVLPLACIAPAVPQ